MWITPPAADAHEEMRLRRKVVVDGDPLEPRPEEEGAGRVRGFCRSAAAGRLQRLTGSRACPQPAVAPDDRSAQSAARERCACRPGPSNRRGATAAAARLIPA